MEQTLGARCLSVYRLPGCVPPPTFFSPLVLDDSLLLLFVAMSAYTQRAALRKARRLSRPFLTVIAPPLVLLLVARLTLGNLLAKRIDPTLELLFGDDIVDL